jgi:hypothetical protein
VPAEATSAAAADRPVTNARVLRLIAFSLCRSP